MIGERADIYLGQVDRCILGCENGQLTKDHIFQTKVGSRHPKIVGPVIKKPFNKARVCEDHHSEIDRDKWGEYLQRGIMGEVLYIARYPRAVSPDLLEIQMNQWVELFTEVQANIRGLNGNTPPHLLPDYSRVADFMEGCLNRWRIGNFESVDI